MLKILNECEWNTMLSKYYYHTILKFNIAKEDFKVFYNSNNLVSLLTNPQNPK